MTKHRITVLLGAVCLLMGWIVADGSKQVVRAQETTGEQSARELLEGDEWRMHSAHVSRTWLYNAKTGKVYRVESQCAEDIGKSGCLMALPVFSTDRLSAFLPNPR